MDGILVAVRRNPESAPSRSQGQTWTHRLVTFSLWLPRARVSLMPCPASGMLPISWGFLAPPRRPVHLGVGSGRVTASPGLLHGVLTPLRKVPLNLAGLSWAVVWEFRRQQGRGARPRGKLLNSPVRPGWPRPCYLLCQKAAGSEHPAPGHQQKPSPVPLMGLVKQSPIRRR